jgi:hypothetical protein
VIPLSLAVVGALVLAAGWLLMRRMGPEARIGRILAVTPRVPVAEAREIAARGANRYVGVFGRVDAEEPFEDEAHRPLVLRRTRLELLRRRGSWEAFEDHRDAVPFEISEGMDRIAVDDAALDGGLVVVQRESVGTARDLADRVPAGTEPETPARLRIELLTAVDHALVLGVPTLDPARGPILRPGLGRPLVLTNLERDEALRLLAHGRQPTTRIIAILLAAGAVGLLTGIVWAVLDALV